MSNVVSFEIWPELWFSVLFCLLFCSTVVRRRKRIMLRDLAIFLASYAILFVFEFQKLMGLEMFVDLK